jgi:hypothetical protein
MTAFRRSCAPVVGSHPAPRIGHLDERTQSGSPWVQTPIAKPAVVLGSRAGNGFQDLDGTGAAVRQPEGGLLADPFAVDGGARTRPYEPTTDRMSRPDDVPGHLG